MSWKIIVHFKDGGTHEVGNVETPEIATENPEDFRGRIKYPNRKKICLLSSTRAQNGRSNRDRIEDIWKQLKLEK